MNRLHRRNLRTYLRESLGERDDGSRRHATDPGLQRSGLAAEQGVVAPFIPKLTDSAALAFFGL